MTILIVISAFALGAILGALADRDKTIGVLRFTIDDLRARAEEGSK